VVVAASGYPSAPRTGDVITGLDDAAALDGVEVLHAGTRTVGSDVVSSGGRVLSVTGVGPTLHEARARAYEAVGLVTLAGSHHRSDIALAAADGRIMVPSFPFL
jgi:phosphoribosylamine--glycine ligase